MILRSATPSDFAAVLALNRESEHFLSPLSAEGLQRLHDQAELHQVMGDGARVVAFLLALREGKGYDSPNYRWFQERYSQFLYVDRVVVSGSRQSSGLGRTLYESVFAHATRTKVPVVACEYDVEPPNPRSERFHRRFGFVEVGRQVVAGGRKQVSLQAVRLGGSEA